jgi:ribonuclease HII
MMADKTLHKIMKEVRKHGLSINSGYRTKEQQDALEQRSCHCYSLHLGPNRMSPGEHHPNCPMYHD